ncbi:MAG: PIN domain-containing protein [Methanosarcinales archaeon Met12]|nr:MAG: PIN domain-containing protein [Methanosarcinales archaeon Met12]
MIFIDTTFWFAHIVETDDMHQNALDEEDNIKSGRYGRPVTSDYVLDELATLLRREIETKRVHEKILGILAAPDIDVIFIGPALFSEGLKILREDDRRKFSMTDATSVALMLSKKIDTIASFDDHFTRYVNVIP